MTKSYLEQEEVKNLEMVASNLRDRLLVRLLSRLGCRVSEALSLTVEDIDLIAGTVKIQHLKSRMRLGCPHCGTALGKKHSYCPGCGKKVAGVVNKEIQQQRMRTLPVDIETLNMLKEYINRGGPVIRNGKHIIFGISRHRSWQIVKECAEKAGLPRLVNSETGKLHNVSPHRLRDSFAVHAVKLNDSGDGLRLLQEHLGHQNFNTTAKYRKVSGKEHREWFNRLWKEDKP